ncbi:MAG: hypothetical protein O2854_02935 [Chloroflexi bacterium]|nr:hypothetical protein [Chloroflexota bacterium]
MAMRVYWKEWKRGEKLILSDEEREEEVGGFRKTPRGYDAFARTFGYDPGRAQKDMASPEEAKEFVESFHPWDLFTPDQVTVEPDVVPMPKENS